MLTVLKQYRDKRYTMFTCRCDCGVVHDFIASNVKRLHTQSCGCIAKKVISDRSKTHGMSKTRIYRIWCNVKNRCSKKSHHNYRWYGGRGIRCEWSNFEAFYSDMGALYIDHVSIYGEKDTTLDRIDNDGNYSKENCRWATMKEQCQKRRVRKDINEIHTFFKGKENS